MRSCPGAYIKRRILRTVEIPRTKNGTDPGDGRCTGRSIEQLHLRAIPNWLVEWHGQPIGEMAISMTPIALIGRRNHVECTATFLARRATTATSLSCIWVSTISTHNGYSSEIAPATQSS